MLDVISTVFWGLVLLAIIVFIHEVGHFVAARAFGLRVKEFMIGLPGPRLSFKRRDTSYGITAIPLGGYCLIAGMEKGEEGPEVEQALIFIAYFGSVCEDHADRAGEALGIALTDGLDTLADWGCVRRYKVRGLHHYAISAATVEGVSYEEGASRTISDPQAFLAAERKLTYTALPWWKRIIVLLAGSFFNLVIAMIILITLLMALGASAPTTLVEAVVADSPAEAAGLAPGDELVSLDGVTFDSWQGFVETVLDHEVGDTVELGYTRDGQEQAVSIKLIDREGSPFVGISPHAEPISVLQAAELSIKLVGLMLNGILQLLNPVTFASTIGQTSSVVGISMEARNAAAAGPFDFILLVAALSISIGFMNLLPIPPLDGGKIIIETIERVLHRRLPASVVNGISLAGIAAMILLFIVATNADIHRYFLGG